MNIVKKKLMHYALILTLASVLFFPASSIYAGTITTGGYSGNHVSSKAGNHVSNNAGSQAGNYAGDYNGSYSEDYSFTASSMKRKINIREVEVKAGTGWTLENWLKVCRTMGANMSRKGFRYSYNSHADSYSEALSGKRRTNCSKYVCWCMQEFGAIEQGQTFYLKHGRKIKKNFDDWDYSKVSVIRVFKSCDAADLKPGDVVLWAGKLHMCIYAGRNSRGHRTWFDAGRQNTHEKCSGSRFKTIAAESCRYLDCRKVGYIIRIKGL